MRNLSYCKSVALLLCLHCTVSVHPEENYGVAPDTGIVNKADSLDSCVVSFENKNNGRRFGEKLDKLSSSKLYRMTYIGVPLIAGGLIMKGEDTHFRSLRNDYLPHFNRHIDDYMQFAPIPVMLGLKAFGVKGRSSWSRMIVSDAFSAVIMGGVVSSLKNSTHVTRPDGSNNHSFPSGHTATAFMAATMLNKEYGHISPWVGVGAYTVASATGLMRMANNKHWLSDVMTGAGIGVISTEVGYYLADLIFNDKGLNASAVAEERFDADTPPSFVSLYIGMNVPLSGYDIDEHDTFGTSSGSTAGVEGAYFFNKYVGIGGRFTASEVSVIVNDNTAEDNTFDNLSLSGGGYFSYPVSSRWLLGGKFLGGYVRYPKLRLSEHVIPARGGFCFGSGLSVSFRAKEHYGIRFFADYNLLPSHSRGSHEYMNTFVLGTSFMVLL